MRNYMLAVDKAVQNDQSSIQNQQMIDATSTENMAKIEYTMYQAWQKLLDQEAGYVAYWAQQGTSKQDQQNVTQWQTYYNAASSKAHSNESQMDGVVQDGQQQTSSDASNLQMKAQMVQAINSIQTTISGFLGRIIS